MPNQWGLFDIYGNVFEWCYDENQRFGSESTGNNPAGADQDTRVLRDASFLYAFSPRSIFPYSYNSDYPDDNIGFRVARNFP